MSGPAAMALVAAVLTANGLGVLAALGLATTARELLRRSAVAPLAGLAWAGVVAATVATLGLRLGVDGLVVLTVATCVAGAVRALRWPAEPPQPRRTRWSPVSAAVAIVSLLAMGVVLVPALRIFWIKPLAEYDGWAMWGMKARAIASFGGDPDVFASDAYARLHLEYPLLLPALHALPLQAADGFSSNTVVLSCLAVGLAGILAIWGALRDRVRPAVLLAFLAGIVTAPAFVGQLLTGYADVPLAMFVVVGVVCLGRWLLGDDTSWLALGTLFVAAAALTKNEGLLFAIAAYGALLATAAGRRRQVLVSAGVVAALYAPWRTYVAIHDLGAPDYDLSSSLNLPWVARRLDRVPEAAEGLLREALDHGQFGLLVGLGIAAIALAALCGARALAAFAAAFAGLSFAGLVWIYVLTPNEVASFLASNGNRVIVSLVLGLAALAPLLVEEAARALAAGEREGRYESARRYRQDARSPAGRVTASSEQ